MTISIEDMASFCKKKGIIYSNSEIYGGLSGFFDYGPLGVELKNNIKNSWWKTFVQNREDVVGIDGAIISHPKVWKASGHVDNFTDVYVKCESCKKPNKVDKNELETAKCDCGGKYEVIGDVNLMFKTNVGPVEGNTSYLRPETAQLIFTNFKLITDTTRQKLPFGIAQIGKAFRNEISPRDFLFRCREFDQMEIEFFIHPDQKKCDLLDEKDFKFNLLTEKDQNNNKEHSEITIEEMLKAKLAGEWHIYWLKETYQWFINLGIDPKNLRLRQHLKDELAHYSSACFDIEYNFPFGWKEIHGNANRGQYDLTQHKNTSKKNLEYFDEETKKKVIPRVIEPSQGLDRAFLALMFESYKNDKERGNIVLNINPTLAPIKVAVFPLVNKLDKEAREVFNDLKYCFPSIYDRGGSVGRRYARADEIGIPYCITIDFDCKEENVTIRSRDSTTQIRIPRLELQDILFKLIYCNAKLEDFGEPMEG